MSPSATRHLAGGPRGSLSRAHRNIAVVAFANKLARIAWAVLRRGETFAAKGEAGGGVGIDRRRPKAPIDQKRFARGDNEMA